MGRSAVTAHLGVSLDGFAAGLNPRYEAPVGTGGMRLHDWLLPTRAWHSHRGEVGGEESADSAVLDEAMSGIGAYIMGRRMFGGAQGPWDLDWRGWWGEKPAFGTPVFVLTHHPREPLKLLGGTTFKFVTAGVQEALAQAKESAGERNVSVAGGPSVVQQFLRAGLLDEITIHLSPVLLGGGRRLFENIQGVKLEQARVVSSRTVTHITYRVVSS